MEFFTDLLFGHSITQMMVVFSAVIALGLLLGNISIFGIRLGIAGVLFSGLLFGHFGIVIDHEIMHFVKEFGLILFVYTIGMMVGPGFFSSFKKSGVTLNTITIGIVLLGGAIAVGIIKWGGLDVPLVAGLFSGGTTNTPSLGAAQQVLQDMLPASVDAVNLLGLGYAVAYPFGIVGIILTMLITKKLFRINIKEEEVNFENRDNRAHQQLCKKDILIVNDNFDGVLLKDISFYRNKSLVFSRRISDNTMSVPQDDDIIERGDILRVVGPQDLINDFQMAAGQEEPIDMRGIKTNLVMRCVLVTHHNVSGQTIDQINPRKNFGVNVTRIARSDVEFAVDPHVTLRLGDELKVVGPKDNVDRFTQFVGNSLKHLEHPFLIPIFIGILLGVIIGNIPIHLPGVPSPVKLGLAGGPLIVALILSRIGTIGKLNWYIPVSSNLMLREVGITLFLACVGLSSGGTFVKTVLGGQGFMWMVLAALITFVPLMIMAIVGRIFFKLNYLTLCGVLAGSMTDPPALAYATSITKLNAPSIGYATVYPLTMILRVLVAQLIIIFFF